MSEQAYQSALKELFTAIERQADLLDRVCSTKRRDLLLHALNELLNVFSKIDLDLPERQDYREKLIQLRNSSGPAVSELIKIFLSNRWGA